MSVQTAAAGSEKKPSQRLVSVAAVLAAVGLGVPALAQDSVSTAGGLPGDGVNAYLSGASGEQVNDFVLDLAPRASSWGRPFAYGPLLKASRSSTNVSFNHGILGVTASGAMSSGPFPRPSYGLWTVPGQGISQNGNAAPASSVTWDGSTLASGFGVALLEAGPGLNLVTGDGDDENNIIAGLVNFQSRRPNRLYISRVVTAVNKPNGIAGQTSTASLGLGGVDERGNVSVLADGFGLSAAERLQGKNYVVIDAAARGTGLNQLRASGPGDADATRTLLNTPVLLQTPTLLPTGAGDPVLVGSNFESALLVGAEAGSVTGTRGHLPGGAGSTRGGVSISGRPFAPIGGSAVGAVLARTDGGDRTRGLQFFGLSNAGAVTGQRQIALPGTGGSLADPTDGYTPGDITDLGVWEFTAYGSQTAFRGGNGPVATTVLPDGSLLAAALVTNGPGGASPSSPHNFIAVARIPASGTAPAAWTVAAHTGALTHGEEPRGKAVLGDYGDDGIPGTGAPGEGDGIVDTTPVGRIVQYGRVFPAAGAVRGPSISAPAMDRAGNLYFVATVSLNAQGGPRNTTALLRANYDAAAHAYRLESLLAVGDTIAGANSGRTYRVASLTLADADSADSGSVWSGNIVGEPLPGVNVASLPSGSPLSLGAMVFTARVVYDFDANGEFRDPSEPGNTGSPDQGYNVAMVVMPRVALGDADRNGVVNTADITAFLSTWFTDRASTSGPPFASDWDGNGVVNTADITAFLSDWFAGRAG